MDNTYKSVEITGSSTESFDAAIRSAIAKTGESVREMRWFEVIETRGQIQGNEVAHWQVTLKIGFSVV